MIVSAVGYFFSIIAIFTTIVAFMTLLIRVYNPLTLEKVRHYPHPRPPIEQTITPTNPEPHHARVALGTNEATPATDLSAQDKRTKDSHAASVAKTDVDSPKPERKIKRERLAHLHQPKVLTRQQQNYEGYGYGMALGSAEGYHPGLVVSDKTQHVDMWSFATIVSRPIPLESPGSAFSANQKRFQWIGSKVS